MNRSISIRDLDEMSEWLMINTRVWKQASLQEPLEVLKKRRKEGAKTSTSLASAVVSGKIANSTSFKSARDKGSFDDRLDSPTSHQYHNALA
jgi:hypothetical protein